MANQIYDFRGAGRYVLGCGSLSRLGGETVGFGKKALLVLDPGLSQAGLQDHVVSSLTSEGAEYVLFQDFVQEPEPTQADAAAKLAREKGCDLVVGVGGGSAMDLAKAAAVLVTNDGKAKDYIGVGLVPKPGLPTIMIPTTAGTGSEVTWTAVFTMRADKGKGGINSVYLYPTLALLDPELTVTVPPAMTAATGMDALCHAIESYTSVKANPMSELMSREAISLIGEYLPIAYADGRNLEARENMLRASLLAGLGLANAGVTAVHALSYPLGAVYNIPHGLANALLLPHVMNFNCLGDPYKFSDVAELLDQDVDGMSIREASKVAAMTVMDLMSDLEMPQGLEAIGIPEDALEDLADRGMKLTRVLENNPRTITRDDALAIYEEAY